MSRQQCTASRSCLPSLLPAVGSTLVPAGIALVGSPVPMPQGAAMHATLGGTEWLAAAGVLYGLYRLWHSGEELRPSTDGAGKKNPRET